MTAYGQFCPVAKAMEVLDERWTLLIVREMLLGSSHYNELRRGVPRMSPALLSKRLRTLERVGVLERHVDGVRTSYSLTEAGLELRPLIQSLSAWGMRWIGDLGEEDLDPHLLLWDMQRTMPIDAWPRARTTLALRLRDAAGGVSCWWIVATEGAFEVCNVDPGYDVAATLSGTLRALVLVWRGDVSWASALGMGELALSGPSDVALAVPGWLGQSILAPA